MTNAKELRSIELASFTTITTGISVVFSIIIAIIIAIVISLTASKGASVAIYLIPTIIVGTFMFTIYNTFCEGLLYNLLAKRFKTIFIEIKDDKEIVKISTTETAMMLSIIATIEAILFYLVSVLILPLFLSTMMQTLMYSGQQILAYQVYKLLLVISQPATIAILIFGTLIITFVFVLLGTLIYNYLSGRGRGIVLNLVKENDYTAIESVDGLKLAIVFAIISGVLNLLFAIIMAISGTPITNSIGIVLIGFIGGFVEAYLIAIFYNYLSPKLGKLKIELID